MREGEAGNIETLLAEIRAQLADLGERVSRLEEQRQVGQALPSANPATVGLALPPPKHAISEDRLIAISAAVAAFLGERVRIRQIRLIRSNAWAQQGRVSVQASHWLHR
jgi:methylmalonyl-CoA carboxyltransferase 12S subunit